MKLKAGTSVSKNILEFMAKVFPGKQAECLDIWSAAQMGITVQIEPIKPQYTREEEAGFHLLLSEWLKADPGITVGVERLKEIVCRAMWGSIRLVGPHGQEEYVAARRTTRKWDSDAKDYIPSKLSREEYAELIDFVDRMAAEDGILLPKLQRKKEHA